MGSRGVDRNIANPFTAAPCLDGTAAPVASLDDFDGKVRSLCGDAISKGEARKPSPYDTYGRCLSQPLSDAQWSAEFIAVTNPRFQRIHAFTP